MGADFLSTDIGRAPQEVGGAFIEFNQVPGLDALITAGWSWEEAGALALGGRVGRIGLDLLLVPDAELAGLQARLAATGQAPSHGWASCHRAQLGCVPLAVPPASPRAGLRALLAHQSVTAVLVLCGQHELERHGLPVDRVDRVSLSGVVLGDAWRQVLLDAAGACSTWPDAHTTLDAAVPSSLLAGGELRRRARKQPRTAMNTAATTPVRINRQKTDWVAACDGSPVFHGAGTAATVPFGSGSGRSVGQGRGERAGGDVFDVPAKKGAQIGIAQTEFDVGLEVAQLAVAVVALALVFVGEHGLGLHEAGQGLVQTV